MEYRWETSTFQLHKFHLQNLEEDRIYNADVIFSALVLRMKFLSKAGPNFLSKLHCTFLLQSLLLAPEMALKIASVTVSVNKWIHR